MATGSAAARRFALFLVAAGAACGEGGPIAALQNFVNLGQTPQEATRPRVDDGALARLRERRLDAANPDRVRVEAEIEAPIGLPVDAAVAQAEAAVRAITAEGQAVAVRVVVVPERLPTELGALAVATAARDGKGWSGEEVSWRSSQALVRTSAPPSDEDCLLAAAVARAPGTPEARLLAAVAASGIPAERVQAAWDRVRQYLGPLPQ
jgi:hypothetical protein